MIKAVIIDDVDKARIALKSDVEDYCPNIEVIGEADGVASGVSTIVSLKPDLVFLDIKMADGSGFDLLEKLKATDNIDFNIIFTTAYDQYAIKAFKYSAIDYLLKPIDPEDLIEAIKKLDAQSPTKLGVDQYQFLMDQIRHLQNPSPKRIALSSTEKIQIVEISDLVRCEASGNYTYFYTTDGQKIIVSKTMKEYVDILEEQDFVRVHHSHLINMDQVAEFMKIDGTYLVMKNGDQVPVSVRKREDLMKKLGSL